ncbi:DUF2157 domain-containing protein [Algibacter sp. L4_22]|uniref:DUF2157 domain-containing protein n=1 Tax=Algibacter sp. L4_22 TaxID=2942477 RepID=UPI00201B67D0|nr:DUF2157 domain-containing protein [Algibacter sp. L4_22]MCL5130112.1 DUF2157 domain-containing protein [Algibacter sp. L4_22]
MSSKLQSDIKELVKHKVISQDVAFKIENYYQSKEPQTSNRLFTVFAVLGSTLVGLGLILILAHNWDHFSRTIKTAFAFLPLVIGQFFVGYSILRRKSETWKEASGAFLFFAVGASMALVSQIYNIPGDLSSYLLTWVLLCLPLIYLLKSNALALLHLIFITCYACSLGYFTSSKTPWLYLVGLGLYLPYYIKLGKGKNISSVLNWLTPLSLVIVLGAFIDHDEQTGFLMYVVLFGLLYNIGRMPFYANEKLRRNGYLIIGSLGTVCMLLTASFKWFWEGFFSQGYNFESQEFVITLIFFIAASGLLVNSIIKKGVSNVNLFQVSFICFTILFYLGLVDGSIAVILDNLFVLALGVMAVKIGADRYHLGVLNYGLLIITALITCRFFDTDISFVFRGLLFVCVGVGFFLTNYIMLKKRKNNETPKI